MIIFYVGSINGPDDVTRGYRGTSYVPNSICGYDLDCTLEGLLNSVSQERSQEGTSGFQWTLTYTFWKKISVLAAPSFGGSISGWRQAGGSSSLTSNYSFLNFIIINIWRKLHPIKIKSCGAQAQWGTSTNYPSIGGSGNIAKEGGW